MAATTANLFAGAWLLIGVVIAHAAPVVEPYKDGESYCFFLPDLLFLASTYAFIQSPLLVA